MKPFRIEIPDHEISELRERLQRTRWPVESQDDGWKYGTDRKFMIETCKYWAEKFDWREWESRLNAYPQFLDKIDDVTIHFLHVRAKGSNNTPILFTHGWPSSVFEYLKIIPLLSDFDLVIPSLPGHGFSTAGKGHGIYQTAEVWHKLMTERLGYSTYISQGGDWGAYLSSRLGRLYPDVVRGIHLSYVVGGLVPRVEANSLSKAEREMLEHRKTWDEWEGAYEHLQSTKPLTIAHALSDSPAGLAAWILEKWRSWTDCDGKLESRFSLDELLANVSLYWFTNTSGSAARLYYETHVHPWILAEGEKVLAPTAVASFPRELAVSPREWAERMYNVVQWTDMPRGGHFAAIEQPALLSEDIKKFVRSLRP